MKTKRIRTAMAEDTLWLLEQRAKELGYDALDDMLCALAEKWLANNWNWVKGKAFEMPEDVAGVFNQRLSKDAAAAEFLADIGR